MSGITNYNSQLQTRNDQSQNYWQRGLKVNTPASVHYPNKYYRPTTDLQQENPITTSAAPIPIKQTIPENTPAPEINQPLSYKAYKAYIELENSLKNKYQFSQVIDRSELDEKRCRVYDLLGIDTVKRIQASSEITTEAIENMRGNHKLFGNLSLYQKEIMDFSTKYIWEGLESNPLLLKHILDSKKDNPLAATFIKNNIEKLS